MRRRFKGRSGRGRRVFSKRRGSAGRRSKGPMRIGFRY